MSRALGLLLVLAACDGGDAARGSSAGGRKAAGDGGEARHELPRYVEIEVADGGAIDGVVKADGDVPRDTVVRPSSDQRVCGQRFLDRSIQRRGVHLSGAIVWLDGIERGKARPRERRFAVTSQRCAVEPRVQAVHAGSTLNVKSDDRLPHRMRILARGGRTLELVLQDNDGQVVPVENVLARPGRLELRCDLHPWTRGWIQVFDHPYFAVSDRDGRFRIDGVPPGEYTLRAWHERLGAIARRTKVEARTEGSVEMEF